MSASVILVPDLCGYLILPYLFPTPSSLHIILSNSSVCLANAAANLAATFLSIPLSIDFGACIQHDSQDDDVAKFCVQLFNSFIPIFRIASWLSIIDCDDILLLLLFCCFMNSISFAKYDFIVSIDRRRPWRVGKISRSSSESSISSLCSFMSLSSGDIVMIMSVAVILINDIYTDNYTVF